MMTSQVFYLKKLLREKRNKREAILVAADWWVVVAENHSKVNKDHRNLITGGSSDYIIVSKFH